MLNSYGTFQNEEGGMKRIYKSKTDCWCVLMSWRCKEGKIENKEGKERRGKGGKEKGRKEGREEGEERG